MNMSKTKHVVFILATSIISMSSLSECSNSSSGSGNTGIQYDATYTFESVNLKYDFSVDEYDDNFMLVQQDAGEFYQAHDTDPTTTSGEITDLCKILQRSDNYNNERKPKITATIRPASGGAPIVHNCSPNDVGNNYVQNLPNLGSNISSILIKVESITTEANQLRLIWSKSFDLNQQWWENIEDTALSGDAEITVGGYTKVMSDNKIFLLRQTDEGYYVIVSYIDEDIMNDGEVDCDVQIIRSRPIPPPGDLDRPIFMDGRLTDSVGWDEPLVGQIVDNN